MKQYQKLINDLETELKELEKNDDERIQKSEKAISLCRLAIIDLKEQFCTNTNHSIEEEIYFFKNQKPKVYSWFLYYLNVFHIESQRPSLAKEIQIKYLKKALNNSLQYLEEKSTIIGYLKSRSTELDKYYFTRGNSSIIDADDNHYYLLDKDFSTVLDYTVAEIKANEKTCIYLQTEICKLKDNQLVGSGKIPLNSPLHWTGSKLDLVELIYALNFSGMINQGVANVSKLTEVFQQIFNVHIEDCYRSWIDIRQRKMDRTKLLTHLTQTLIRKMEEADG